MGQAAHQTQTHTGTHGRADCQAGHAITAEAGYEAWAKVCHNQDAAAAPAPAATLEAIKKFKVSFKNA